MSIINMEYVKHVLTDFFDVSLANVRTYKQRCMMRCVNMRIWVLPEKLHLLGDMGNKALVFRLIFRFTFRLIFRRMGL